MIAVFLWLTALSGFLFVIKTAYIFGSLGRTDFAFNRPEFIPSSALLAIPALSVIVFLAANFVFAPLSDRFVMGEFAKRIQGNDVSHFTIKGVLESPVALSSEALALPDSISRKLRNDADKHIQEVAPLLRAVLGPRSLDGTGSAGITWDFGAHLSGRELVHTSYIMNEDLLVLIACHVITCAGRNHEQLFDSPAKREIIDWYAAFRRALSEEVMRI